MKATSSPQQVAWGVALGILLQSVPVLILVAYYQLHPLTGEARGWAGIAAPGIFAAGILSMGMWQVLTILPAALLLLLTGKHGIVRGLLYVGTFLAIGNILVLIWLYTIMHRATF